MGKWLKGIAKATALLAAVCAILLAVRALLAPDWHEPPVVVLAGNEIDTVRQLLEPDLLNRQELANQVSQARFLLVGETHFRKETVAYFLGLLEDIDREPVVMLLELPESTQPAIDRYMSSGDEREFDNVWGEVEALPLHEILRWAYLNRQRVQRVLAMDEDSFRIFLNRAVLDDTRNETMMRALMKAADDHPSARIVAYGGAMHMMLGGRYRFDVDNRRPVGLRLLESGIEQEEIASISLVGDDLPIATALPVPAAMDLQGNVGLLPYEDFYEYPVYGVSRIRELHTHVVYLGPLTRQGTWVPGSGVPD